ncbi:unnamed protein product [Cylicocyclus nassatus]|uniref:Uncharacterized protein n=1 Tax=Cylicocyclus nassatus TaxID=53992 RepID=A0AA36H8P6_CYLNA|nr:unnamed protein product [Cylicocyclus nassatus]
MHSLRRKIGASMEIKRKSKEVLPVLFTTVQKTYTSIDWLEFLSQVSPVGVHRLFQDDTFMVKAPPTENLIKLDAVLRDASKTVFSNLVMTGYIKSWLDWMDKRFAALAARAEGKQRRTEQCFSWVKGHFNQALHAAHARFVNAHQANRVLTDISDNLRNAFIQMVNEKRNWTNNTKEALIRKMRKMGRNLGFSDLALGNLEDLDYLYSEYIQVASPDGLKFLEIENMFERISLEYEYGSLNNATVSGKDAKRRERIMYAFNAGYDARHNKFQIGTTLLQFPAFSYSLPKQGYSSFYNYGYIGGAIMGHEMMHAYDIQSINRNENGVPSPLWLPDDFRKSHDLKMNLLQNMYQKHFEILGYDHLMKSTKQENFADTQGLILAYRAYQNAKREGKTEPRISSIPDFSDNQLFFLSYAQASNIPS